MEYCICYPMKRQPTALVLLLLTVSFSGCIGENEVSSTDDGPSWINETGTTDQHWAIQLDDDEWLEVKSAAVILEYYLESGNLTETQGYTILESNGWTVNGYSPIFGGSYTGCYFNSELYECIDDYYPNVNQGFTVTEWSVIYRVHEV